MNPQVDPLAALRDIHLPVEPGWWPPAPGWWILGLIAVAISVLIFRSISRRRRLRLPSRELLSRLQQLSAGNESLNNYDALVEISGLTRRYVVTRYGRKQTAGLTGERWLQFLDRISGTNDFTQGVGKCLADGPYQGRADFELETLITSVERLAKRSRDTDTPH